MNRHATTGVALGLWIAGAAHGQGWMTERPAGGAPAPASAATLDTVNQAIERFWIHQAGFGGSSYRSTYFGFDHGRRIHPGDELPAELARVREEAGEVTRALRATLLAGTGNVLLSRRPVLTSEWPGPALWRRVSTARLGILMDMVEGRWQDFRETAEALYVLGSVVARGREEDTRPERMVLIRLGLECQLAALHAIHQADAEGWLPEGDERRALAGLVLRWEAGSIPWHLFEDPAQVKADGWFGATATTPQGTHILHRVASYRQVLLESLAYALARPRGELPEGWPARRVDGGEGEPDVVLYPYPADGFYRRPVPGL